MLPADSLDELLQAFGGTPGDRLAVRDTNNLHGRIMIVLPHAASRALHVAQRLPELPFVELKARPACIKSGPGSDVIAREEGPLFRPVEYKMSGCMPGG